MPVLAELIRNSVAEHAERLAVIDATDGSTHTYGQLDRSFNRVANALDRLGLAAGDHVAILQRNSHHWLACEGGLAKGGMVTVPLNVYLAPQELEWLLNHSEARAVLLTGDECAALEPVRGALRTCRRFLCVPGESGGIPAWATDFAGLLRAAGDADAGRTVDPRHPHRIMYTSATTGVPKGVICPNEVYCDSVLATLANQLCDVREEDRFLAATPLTHMAIGYFWSFFARGAASVIMRQFSAERVCELIEEHRITHTLLVPTMIIMLLEYLRNHPAATERLKRGSLRAIWYAGSPIPVTVAQEAERVIGPILNQQYGLTEILSTHPAFAVTQLRARWHALKPGSCGRPMIGSIVKVVDERGAPLPPGELGEVVIRMHGQAGGYWRKPDAAVGAFQDGWIHSGDIGCFDGEGFLYIKDRKNDMVISGGFNIYPTEVENVLAQHPGVYQCAVVGVPDPKWVEAPWAMVVRRAGVPPASEAELIGFARDRLAHYKAPQRIAFVEALPTSSIGKILKRRIREMFREQLGPEAGQG